MLSFIQEVVLEDKVSMRRRCLESTDGACMIKNVLHAYENKVMDKYGEAIDDNERESFKKIIKAKFGIPILLSMSEVWEHVL